MPIPIIDLFAGPGGLGEGFTSLIRPTGGRVFSIGLSVEMDSSAHKTLELRAFVRQFSPGKAPDDYYAYLEGSISKHELFEQHPVQAKEASSEAWQAELGGASTPDDLVDSRIRKALGASRDWVLIGGPPCQAYSLVGRSRVIGGNGRDKYEADPRHHLYRHYLRILAVHRPPVFVMENVKGILSATIKKHKTFERIIADLQAPLEALPQLRKSAADTLGYRLYPISPTGENLDAKELPEPDDFIVRSERHGIPQARHRVIIVGVRQDLAIGPQALAPAPRASVREAIGDLPRVRSGLSKGPDSPNEWVETIRGMGTAAWLRNGGNDPDVLKSVRNALDALKPNLGRGSRYIPKHCVPRLHPDWYADPRLLGVCNHETRGHIEKDLHRYLFASAYARAKEVSPLLEDFPRTLLPLHGNVSEALEATKFNDRFRVQVAGRPATTVVSHISKDGHYFIHYDPSQCRSLTVREAARLQTFPDNYFFEGARTDQYRQVGNAVPPLLAKQIAEKVARLFKITRD